MLLWLLLWQFQGLGMSPQSSGSLPSRVKLIGMSGVGGGISNAVQFPTKMNKMVITDLNPDVLKILMILVAKSSNGAADLARAISVPYSPRNLSNAVAKLS
ncbi:uncharacterized protein LOC132281679 isoform X2 [Cornus florida]|uniref:uncharacterized protein LOC132281679 isoform X2 n=1 Tax=Cornus florida TaxID=4283 RepID=UPI002897E29A|nr:uncharacterized protein LOC132281679 isoform X2 [Cornus florida]